MKDLEKYTLTIASGVSTKNNCPTLNEKGAFVSMEEFAYGLRLKFGSRLVWESIFWLLLISDFFPSFATLHI